jgi:Zn-dependent protease with chaperone function
LLLGVAIAASVVLSPALFVLFALLAVGVAQVMVLPDVVRQGLVVAIEAFVLLRSTFGTGPGDPGRLAASLVVLLAPSLLAVGLLWLATFSRLCAVGRDAMLAALRARPPNNDREEQQLRNVVEEIAIAAGVSPPAVALTDLDFVNALVLGRSPSDATIVVSRRLLDELDRDQTQGVLAHLIASIGNGDLRVTFAIGSIVQTLGLLFTILDVPLSGRALRRLALAVRVALLLPAGQRAQNSRIELAGELMRGHSGLDTVTETLSVFDELNKTRNPVVQVAASLRFVVSLPLILISLELKLVIFLFTLCVMGPAFWTILRARRHLADAGAVQLTRHPDGLAGALLALVSRPRSVPGIGWCEPLMALSGHAASAAGVLGVPPAEAVTAAIRAERQDAPTQGEVPMVYWAAHPPIRSRLRRLRAQGSTLVVPEPSRSSSSTASASSGSESPDGQSPPREPWRLWDPSNLIALPIVLVLGAFLALMAVSFVGGFLYLLGVGVLGAAIVLGGWYLVAFEIVAWLVAHWL